MQQRTAQDLAQAMRDGCLGVRIGRLHRVVARRFDQALRPLGLTLPQLEVLGVLMLRGPLKPTAVADALEVERSTISRNLALMQQRGWIALDPAPSGRAASATITKQGIEILAQAKTAWAQAQAYVVGGLGSETPATIDKWLDALAAADPPVTSA
jgi:DNA-binding MarR family transcriptional regulator